MSLLSLSPLLSSLFITYANKVAALESGSTVPSPESEEWKVLQSSITMLREENEKLRSGNRDVVLKSEAAEASQEAFHSQILSLKKENAAQQDEIKSLQRELHEVKSQYDQLATDSTAEKTAHKIRISDLEAQRVELKQTVVEQQVKISKLERQLPEDGPPPVPARQHPPPPTRPRDSLTSSETTVGPRLRTPSPERIETAQNLSLTSAPIREEDVSTSLPGPNERLRPQTLRGSPLPVAPKPQPQSLQRKFSHGKWLKALNDSF